MNRIQIGSTEVSIMRGDLTLQEVDVIVNAANRHLLGGAGVDGAIHFVGGPAIMDEVDRVRESGGCATGEAFLTNSGRLRAKKVIHTVGPRWWDHSEPECKSLLTACYRNSLNLAIDNNLRTIAFPAISTGAYGFPRRVAAPVAIRAVQDFLITHPNCSEEVRFVLFSDDMCDVYLETLTALSSDDAEQ